jgi:hypothetical protein
VSGKESMTMKTLTCLALAAALALAAGCSDDDPPAVTGPDAATGSDAAPATPDGAPSPDAGAPDMSTPDAGTPDTGEPAGITLVDWVTDLTANHTTATSLPDSVDDKKIIDTSDPAAFDPLLQ